MLNDIEDILEKMGIKYEEHESKYKMNYMNLSQPTEEEVAAGAQAHGYEVSVSVFQDKDDKDMRVVCFEKKQGDAHLFKEHFAEMKQKLLVE